MVTRRHFLAASAASCVAAARAQPAAGAYSFLLLGDLHFDRWEHHDRAWLEKHHPGDLSQIENYTRLTREVMPQVFAALKQRADALRADGMRPAFALQVGDLVEGLCGSAELAALQNREAVASIEEAALGLPFVFTKGNHDITGDGAVEAFQAILRPFMAAQARQLDAAAGQAGDNWTLRHDDDQWVFFDAYDKTSLDWLESTLAQRTARHLFVSVHPPVVPYGARASWHLFAGDKARAQREHLLALLGRHQAIVLGGHLHKFSALTRTAGGGRFTQLAVSSVVSSPHQTVRQELRGVASYHGGQVDLEPRHSPETAPARRAIYETERASVTAFEFADTAGYAVITVDGTRVEAAIHAGTAALPFRTVRLAG